MPFLKACFFYGIMSRSSSQVIYCTNGTFKQLVGKKLPYLELILVQFISFSDFNWPLSDFICHPVEGKHKANIFISVFLIFPFLLPHSGTMCVFGGTCSH